ncbi:RCC1 domain-containing protein [Myxococcota bacterium]
MRCLLLCGLVLSSCFLTVPDPAQPHTYPCESDEDCLAGYACVEGHCSAVDGDGAATGDGECIPETDAQFCARLDADCGTLTAHDNCELVRTVDSCGTCTSPAFCGGGGPNTCDSGPCLSLAAGSVNPTNRCEWCEPGLGVAAWTPVACEQTSPIDPCRATSGDCNPALVSGTCEGLGCCEFEPAWPAECPMAGDDLDADGIKDAGESWRGTCNDSGECTGCTGPSECDDGNPCSVDACNGGVCQHDRTTQLGADCTVVAADDGTCVAIAANIACRLKNGQQCSDGATCASEYCVHGYCCNGTCSGTCGRCDRAGSQGTCSSDIGRCSGTCAECVGTAFQLDCAPVQSDCPASGATLCTTCVCSGTDCDCSYDQTQDGDCSSVHECAAAGTCLGSIGALCATDEDCVMECSAGRCWDPDAPHPQSIGTGGEQTCVVLSDQTVPCWGKLFPAQNTVPVPVPGLDNVTALASGGHHTCVLKATQYAYCWGYNDTGQLGDDGVSGTTDVPVLVSDISNVTALAAGSAHTCALLNNQTVYCWGTNTGGALGDGTLTERHTPVPVTGLTGAQTIAAGMHFTCAIVGSGNIKCWGWNSQGQIGDGTNNLENPTPVDVVGISDAQLIAAGMGHACAVRAGGSVACWGDNQTGQLGDDQASGGSSSVPVATQGLTNVTALSVGNWHTCALLADQTIKCWGYNFNGGLGDGSQEDRHTPVSVVGLDHVQAIAAGGHYSCAVLEGGSTWCWGDNHAGQLGNGTLVDSPTPILVAPW